MSACLHVCVGDVVTNLVHYELVRTRAPANAFSLVDAMTLLLCRYKVANMAREVESTHAFLESLAYRIVAVERAGGDWLQTILKLGAEAALAKVQATKCFEHCAREAAHLHGGNSYVKGNRIESLYRYGVVDTIPPASSLLERTFCLIYHTALLMNHKMTLMGCHFTFPPVYRWGDAMQPISVSSLGGEGR